MHLLELPFLSPAEQLASDETILDLAENGLTGEALIFWEPQETFVVVGYANKVSTEVNVAACQQQGVPIYRRCSGGGTIVQMPGGLNYSLILKVEDNGPLHNITAANRFIMEKNCAAIASIDPSRSFSVRGHTDLCVGNLKFAGNSQRRRKHFLLFHGTLLLNSELALVETLLLMPSLQPEYRAKRPHREFITNLNLPAQAIKTALAKVWKAEGKLENPPWGEIKRLAQEKYATGEWNCKF